MTRIKKIHKLNIASFRNFCWNATISEFSDNVNIFLGWNGSGKTAISRLFSSFEKNELCTQISSGTFEVHIDGTKHTQTSISGFQDSIRVFNEDYIKQILGEGMLPHIIYIGDTAVDYSKQEKLFGELDNEIKEITYTDNFTQIATDEAEKIKKIPGIALINKELQTGLYNNYYNTGFIKRIDNISDKINQSSGSIKVEDFILTEDIVQEYRNKLANQELKYKQFGIIKKWDDWIVSELDTLNTLLSFSPTASISGRIDKFLKEEKDWIERGVVLHKLNKDDEKKDTCMFCNSTITNADELVRHFTNDIIELTNKIKAFSVTINNGLTELAGMTEFYQTEKTELVNVLTNIQSELTKKEEDKGYLPPEAIVFTTTINEDGTENETLDTIAHQLETHYVAKKYTDYTSRKKTYDDLKAKKDLLLIQKKDVEQELITLKAKEQDLHLAPEKLNKLLEITFPYKKIKLTNSSDGIGYVLTRNGNNCSLSDLSEGERNFIALVYFLISINSNGGANNLSQDGIVLIDDPISSLDKNSIFQVFSLIATEVQSKPDRQYFLLTHNLDFFSHLHTHFKVKASSDEPGRIDNQFYEIRFGSDGSSIGKLNRLLANYRTDYQYAISKLLKLENSTDMEDAFLVVNLLRRVLETFLQFKFGEGDYRGKLEKMYILARDMCLLRMGSAASEYSKEEVRQEFFAKNRAMYNFTNYGSHKFSGVDTIDETLLLSSSSMIKDFFKLVKMVDKEHSDYITRLNT